MSPQKKELNVTNASFIKTGQRETKQMSEGHMAESRKISARLQLFNNDGNDDDNDDDDDDDDVNDDDGDDNDDDDHAAGDDAQREREGEKEGHRE